MNPLGPCLVILTQKVPGVWDSSELHSIGTLRSVSKGQYTPQLSSYLCEEHALIMHGVNGVKFLLRCICKQAPFTSHYSA